MLIKEKKVLAIAIYVMYSICIVNREKEKTNE